MAAYTLEKGKDYLYRYDVGVDLKIAKEYADCRVQFYSREYPEGIEVEPHNGYVQVPDEILQHYSTIDVYAFNLDTNSAYTKSKTTFIVKDRGVPAHYEIMPSQAVTYATFEDLIAYCNEAVDIMNDTNDDIVMAEIAREDAEELRAQAEALRVEEFTNNEIERQETFETNEFRREDTFITNEATRQNVFEITENNRKGAELARVSAERDRVTAENAREAFMADARAYQRTWIANEETRTTNEQARKTAELQRERYIASLEARLVDIENRLAVLEAQHETH